jgi:DNA-binding protein HU-beta
MKKSDFVRVVAEKSGVSKKDVESVLKTSLETIQDILVSGDSITFMGFGTFTTVERKERETVLPNSKKKVLIPARKSVRFKVGKTLKERVAEASEKKKTTAKKKSTTSRKRKASK